MLPVKDDILALQAQIEEINQALGWRDTTPSFSEAMMLLVTECGEAADAWRKYGFEDVTGHTTTAAVFPGGITKPEGVGSEFADIAIRLLDDCQIFGIKLERVAQSDVSGGQIDPPPLLEAMFAVVKHAAVAEEAWRSPGIPDVLGVQTQFEAIWLLMCFYSLAYDVDLDFEIRRKLAYNRTRGYRHGGRRM